MHTPNNRTRFAAEEVPLSQWLVVMAMLVVDGSGNDILGLWLVDDFHRFKEREIGWSTAK